MSATPTGPPDGQAAGRFEETRWVLEPGDRFRRPPRGWDDALVILQTGDIDVDSAGERRRFRAGSILTFAALRAPVQAVNAGTVDAVLVGVRRRQPAPVRVPEKIRFLLPIGAVPTPGCARACAASDQEGTPMSSERSAQETEPVTGPNEDLRALERLIGTWAVAGGA